MLYIFLINKFNKFIDFKGCWELAYAPMSAVYQSFSYFGQLIEKSAFKIVLIFIATFLNNYLFLPELEQLRISIDWLGLVSIAIYCFNYLLIYVFCCLIFGYSLLDHKNKTFNSYIKSHFVTLFSDILKTYVKVMMFAFLLILPALYKYICYIFVPFVSLENNNNNKFNVDSLKQSNSLTKSWKTFFVLLFIFIVFVPIDLLISNFIGSDILSLLIVSASTVLSFYYLCLVFSIYKPLKP